jgi:hypothetical protein
VSSVGATDEIACETGVRFCAGPSVCAKGPVMDELSAAVTLPSADAETVGIDGIMNENPIHDLGNKYFSTMRNISQVEI